MKSSRFARRLALTVTGVAMAFSFAGVANATSPKKITSIGLMVQDMSNPFFSAMERGAKRAAKSIGATVNTQDAQLDLANQNTQIDAFIQQGVNLIVISAVDESGIEPESRAPNKPGSL